MLHIFLFDFFPAVAPHRPFLCGSLAEMLGDGICFPLWVMCLQPG